MIKEEIIDKEFYNDPGQHCKGLGYDENNQEYYFIVESKFIEQYFPNTVKAIKRKIKLEKLLK